MYQKNKCTEIIVHFFLISCLFCVHGQKMIAFFCTCTKKYVHLEIHDATLQKAYCGTKISELCFILAN